MRYPIGIQGFKKLREFGYVYVDKTARMYELTSTGSCYFLSRPRRFGKSLLISTMRAYFEGRKELFKGLAIEQMEKEWKEYPVLYLDLNTGKYDTLDNLERNLKDTFDEWDEIYGVSTVGKPFETRFKNIVRRAYEKKGEKVVILVDEYDKPILTAIDNEELQEKFRQTLKSIYSVLKTQDEYIRFAFLTGVSKFSRLSVFSDLNNLKDITFNKRYADICGISEKELHTYFNDSIKELAEENSMSCEDTYAKLKEKYDGYHFAPNTVGMYNPFSLLNALEDKTLGDYWFESGTPTFLVKMLRAKDYDLRNLQLDKVPAKVLSQVDSMKSSAIPLLYQSGYLTIKSHDKDTNLYQLGFPNREVAEGFMQSLLPLYTSGDESDSILYLARFVEYVKDGNAEGFMSNLKAFLDGGKYALAGALEKYFQNTMYLIFRLMGFNVDVEYITSDGRIDVVVKTKDYIYVMELNVDVPAEKALAQIDSKEYMLAFADDGRKLYKIGVSFSSKTRRISEYQVKSEK
ncbi:MAG: ATP-binding protein [Prevotella sp.]|nr:ATP-binding protein [Prevotella sp.]